EAQAGRKGLCGLPAFRGRRGGAGAIRLPRTCKQMIVQALTLTLLLALMVSAILLVIGVPLAYWLAFSRRRWEVLVEAVVSLPILLPPAGLGFYVLVAVGSLRPVGRWYQALTGHPLAFAFEGLVIGSVLYSLPFAVQPMVAGVVGGALALGGVGRVVGGGWA